MLGGGGGWKSGRGSRFSQGWGMEQKYGRKEEKKGGKEGRREERRME